MSTQWRVGGMGAVLGLVYEALPVVATAEFRSERWPEILSDIQTLEAATLDYMRQKRG